ncbi:MAG: flagellar hook-length control protein FliK, partial [Candidatus Glassbacteria bacterium]|nr:flagellar hook-length control protein FliK [Candidatus Glassbacteria bacterium]
VNAIFDSRGKLLTGFAALNAALGVGLAVTAESDADSSSSEGPALSFQLSLFPDMAPGAGAAAGPAAAEHETEVLPDAAESWSSLISLVLERLQALGSGNSEPAVEPGEQKILPGIAPVVESGTAGAAVGAAAGAEVAEALQSGTVKETEESSGLSPDHQDKTETVIPVENEQSAPAADAGSAPEAALNLSGLSPEIFQVLSDLVSVRLEHAAELNDPGKAVQVLSLLENLSGLEELPPVQQLAALESLIGELEALGTGNLTEGAETTIMPDSGAQAAETLQPVEMYAPGLTEQVSTGSQGQPAPAALELIVKRLVELKGLIAAQLSAPAPESGDTASPALQESSVPKAVTSELRSVAETAARLAQLIETVVSERGQGPEPVAQSTPDDPSQRPNNALISLLSKADEAVSGIQQPDLSRKGQDRGTLEAPAAGSVSTGEVQSSAGIAGSGFSVLAEAAAPESENSAGQGVMAADTGVFSVKPETPDIPVREEARNTLNISGKPEIQTESRVLQAENTVSRADEQTRAASGAKIMTDSPAAGTKVGAAETSVKPAPEKELSLQAQSGSVREKEYRLNIPVRLVEASPAQTNERRQATLAYAGQVQPGNSDSLSEQLKAAGRSAEEKAPAKNIFSGVIESLQAKGGSLDNRQPAATQAESLAALKGEPVQQALQGEPLNIRTAGARGEQAVQQNSGTALTSQAEILGKITQAARMTSVPGTSEITMRLEPDHLGQMRVRLSVDEHQFVSARIQVESHEARSLIESSLQRLRDSLAEHGLKIEKFSVDVRQDQHQQHGQQSASTDRESTSRNRGGYFRDHEAETAGKELPFAGEEKTVPVRKLGYNTLEWVA